MTNPNPISKSIKQYALRDSILNRTKAVPLAANTNQERTLYVERSESVPEAILTKTQEPVRDILSLNISKEAARVADDAISLLLG